MEQLTREFPLSELTHSLRLALAVRETKKRKVKTTTNNVKTSNSTAADTADEHGEDNVTTKSSSSSSSPTYSSHVTPQNDAIL